MPIKPGPIPITIGAFSLLADSFTVSYETQPFDRVEFDHEKLRTAPLTTGVTPLLVTLLGGVPGEIVINCALTGMVGGASGYIPRPLNPNAYMTDFNNVKQRVDITRFRIAAQAPEAACPAATVDNLFSTYLVFHKNLLAQFQNRLAIFNTPVGYESLLAAQADNIQSLYFTTGVSFTGAEYSGITNIMVVDGTISEEFVIPNSTGGYDIYKTFDLTLEKRTVVAASHN